MDVQEFQKSLVELCSRARKNGKILNGREVRDFFAGMDLDRSQLLKVLQYLKTQGITIEGVEKEQEEEPQAPAREKVPLTPEEKAYLKDYKKGLEGCGITDTPESRLFEGLAEGEEAAEKELTARYLPVAADMAAEANCEEIFLADLIQEANLGLLTALETAGDTVRDDAWLRGEIRRGIQQAIEAQTQRKFEDDCLVAKVEHLDAAVKDLTEDEEDGKSEFSIGELAVILDMNVEEIRSILRLTGEDS